MLIELWKLSRLETGPNLAKFNNSKRIKLKAKIGKGNNEGHLGKLSKKITTKHMENSIS